MSLHPFSKDLKEVPTAQIEKQLQELRTKYLKARNPEIQKQLNPQLSPVKCGLTI